MSSDLIPKETNNNLWKHFVKLIYRFKDLINHRIVKIKFKITKSHEVSQLFRMEKIRQVFH